MTTLSPEQLSFEIEDVIRSMPGPRDFSTDPDRCIPWLGRASAAMNAWDLPRAVVHFEPLIRLLAKSGNFDLSGTCRELLTQLHQARSDLRLKGTGPLSIGVDAGRTFDYFDEVRRLIETAKLDLFFIDAYIDAEFVSRYLPHVPQGTKVRVLAREKLATLRPAVEAFVSQTPMQIEVRTASGFHDRYVLVDGLSCYQSGASFKDGAKRAPTTLTEITDAFGPVQTTYEQLWAKGKAIWP